MPAPEDEDDGDDEDDADEDPPPPKQSGWLQQTYSVAGSVMIVSGVPLAKGKRSIPDEAFAFHQDKLK